MALPRAKDRLVGKVLAPVRVVLYGVPGIAGDVLRHTIAESDDVELVAEASTEIEFAIALRRVDPDVVVCGVDDSTLPDACRELLDERARLRVLSLDSGADASLYELRPHRRVLGNLSPSSLLAALHRSEDVEW